jgi:pyridoxal 5'-phosphate synthase pdxT subunit
VAHDRPVRIGVLALQGAFAAHTRALARLGLRVGEVRTAADLADVDALVLPGGESTTMAHLIRTTGLDGPLREWFARDRPVLATCAGLILVADEVLDGRIDQQSYGLLDITVRRNAYGRQIDSFETDLDIVGLDEPFHAVFIRAPVIERIGSEVEVLATWDERPVMVRQGRRLAVAFHPELSHDVRIHELFSELLHQEV